MAQLFSPRADRLVRGLIAVAALSLFAAAGLAFYEGRSKSAWNVGEPADQPIPFRHDVHVGGLKLACGTCHAGAERASEAGMPSAETCLGCHDQIMTGLRELEPLRTAAAFGTEVPWAQLHELPEHSYFHHGIHAAKGVACETCHGRVDQMTRTVKTQTLSMAWCLDCHRDPHKSIRPPDKVAEMGWTAGSADQAALRAAMSRISPAGLTDCSVCHR